MAAAGARWDGRWRIEGPAVREGARIGALGAAGLRACPDWRETGLPRASLLATPALWRNDALIAAPVAAPGVPGARCSTPLAAARPRLRLSR
ncbi:MAG: hypothetical protein JKP98_20630 [Rhodobacteraceae bacterium]|nr:hypothetical protein [Paracoccaceae bacterium]